MTDFEKMNAFYLGKIYDHVNKKTSDDILLLDSKDLTTHAVCVGMTGSGKTGLCISLLEEAAIDSIPAIIIDPKGDITNLLLTFPELKKEDFLPWINESDAVAKGLTLDDFTSQQAAMWKKGIESWGQNGERISKLKNSADFRIYTPGSSAGVPVSILNTFKVPDKSIIDEPDLFNEKISGSVTGLLNLLGINADPIKSREYILVSNIFKEMWMKGEDLDLVKIINFIQKPPFEKIGALELNSFYPQKERFELSLSINNLLSSPTFSSWLTGEALDIKNFLYTSEAKPRISIFYIAHLSDNERMFFVSILLNQILSWVRTQSGTTSLRALLYIDEIFGYFPPTANPPSKKPLLTLMKQARAFGLGVVLATQNPVDLDYKGLSNAGTWFIGRLQTEQDRKRVTEGLESALSESGNSLNSEKVNELLANLDKRVFLLQSAHLEQPLLFHTRWALSYLRGPLTRNQIKNLSENSHNKTFANKINNNINFAGVKPIISDEIPVKYFPIYGRNIENTKQEYYPHLFGTAKVLFIDAKTKINLEKQINYIVQIRNENIAVNWDNSDKTEFEEGQLLNVPEENIAFNNDSNSLLTIKNFNLWQKEFVNFIFRTEKLQIYKSNILNMISDTDESDIDFRIRITQIAREKKDEFINNLREKYSKKLNALELKIRSAEQKLATERNQVQGQTIQTAVNVGATLLGALFGRKAINTSTISRAGSVLKGAGRTMKEKDDVKRAETNLELYRQQLAELEDNLNSDIEMHSDKFNVSDEQFEIVEVRAKKINIHKTFFSIVWAPYRRYEDGKQEKSF